MYVIEFYKDENGNEPVKEWLLDLKKKAKSKESRIRYNKVLEYLYVLEANGTYAGLPYTKHIGGDMWELRPRDDRILFFGVTEGRIVLLHQFEKKTKKTPKRELEIARKRMSNAVLEV